MGDNGERGEILRKLHPLAEGEVKRLVAQLPAHLRERVQSVPVFFEMGPDAEDVATGIAEDTLGLFDEGGADVPMPRIRLWLGNLWDYSGEDEEVFLEEVGATFLHEVGHLLGWDEEDLEMRDLS